MEELGLVVILRIPGAVDDDAAAAAARDGSAASAGRAREAIALLSSSGALSSRRATIGALRKIPGNWRALCTDAKRCRIDSDPESEDDARTVVRFPPPPPLPRSFLGGTYPSHPGST